MPTIDTRRFQFRVFTIDTVAYTGVVYESETFSSIIHLFIYIMPTLTRYEALHRATLEVPLKRLIKEC